MARGIGGPHVGFNMTWPIAIAVRMMTADNDIEAAECLDLLITTTADTGLMHESFNVDDPENFTRSWFAWANGVFAEAVLQLVTTRPALLIKPESIADA